MNLQINHLLYTRGQKWDYMWVRGAKGVSLDKYIKPIDAWMEPVGDRNLVMFWTEAEWRFLLQARRLTSRCDKQGRPIAEHSYFVWKHAPGLKYSHLHVLLNRLSDETHAAIVELPDTHHSPRTSERNLSVDVRTLDEGAMLHGSSPRHWFPREDSNWERIAQSKTTLEVPQEWQLKELLDPVWEREIQTEPEAFIAWRISERAPLPKNGTWIVSYHGRKTTTPRLAGTEFNPTFSTELNAQQQGEVIKTATSFSQSLDSERSNSDDDVTLILKVEDQIDADPAAESPEPSSPAQQNKNLLIMAGRRYSDVVANDTRTPLRDGRRSSKKDKTPWLGRRPLSSSAQFGDSDLQGLLEQLTALIMPMHVTHGYDLADGWTNLMHEIGMHSKTAPKEMRAEYGRRLYDLLDQTIDRAKHDVSGWKEPLKKVCDEIRRLIMVDVA